MKVLALQRFKPGTNDEQLRPHLQPEAARLWQLYQSGTVRELYFRQERNEAILVLECQSVEEAERVLATLPMATAGLVCFEVIGLAPYPGFARLFSGFVPGLDLPGEPRWRPPTHNR